MQLIIKSPNIDLNPRVRLVLVERVREVFSRMQDKINRITITLSDINGPKGGEDDIQCKVKLTMANAPTILVVSRKDTLLKAFSHGISRCKSTLGRKLQHRSGAQRQRPIINLTDNEALQYQQA